MERMPADEERLQRKDAAQAVITKITPNDAIDASMAAEPHDIWKRPEHGDELVKRLGAVALITYAIEFSCVALHLFIAGEIA